MEKENMVKSVHQLGGTLYKCNTFDRYYVLFPFKRDAIKALDSLSKLESEYDVLLSAVVPKELEQLDVTEVK